MTHKIDYEKNQIVIDFDPDSTEKSKSGKTVILSTSNGFKWEKGIGISYNIVKKCNPV